MSVCCLLLSLLFWLPLPMMINGMMMDVNAHIEEIIKYPSENDGSLTLPQQCKDVSIFHCAEWAKIGLCDTHTFIRHFCAISCHSPKCINHFPTYMHSLIYSNPFTKCANAMPFYSKPNPNPSFQTDWPT